MEEIEDRQPKGQRKTRLTVGSASVPISIIVNTLIFRTWGDSMGIDFTIAAASVVSSIISVGVLCFWDLRGIVLSRFHRRRRQP